MIRAALFLILLPIGALTQRPPAEFPSEQQAQRHCPTDPVSLAQPAERDLSFQRRTLVRSHGRIVCLTSPSRPGFGCWTRLAPPPVSIVRRRTRARAAPWKPAARRITAPRAARQPAAGHAPHQPFAIPVGIGSVGWIPAVPELDDDIPHHPSNDPPGSQQDECLRDLDGQKLVSVDPDIQNRSRTFKFDLNGNLEIWPSTEIADDQWGFYSWNGEIVTLRHEGVLIFEKADLDKRLFRPVHATWPSAI
jgi:hypothetical protein